MNEYQSQLSCLLGQRVNNKENFGLELGLLKESGRLLLPVSFDLDPLA